jgi:hypothetical protein
VLAFALAKFIDPSFRWITVRESSTEPSAEESWIHRLVPEAQIPLPLPVSDLGQGPTVDKPTFESMVRLEGATADKVALDLLLLLPERFQRMLDESVPPNILRAIVVANTNRVRAFYPQDPGRLRGLMEIFPRHGISIITTSMPPPFEGRYGYSVSLRLDVESAETWRIAQLVVEKGLPSGEFSTGRTISCNDLPWYLEAGKAIEKASI